MPHMANLTWICFFLAFNINLLIIFFSINFSSVKTPTNTILNLKQNKKWQW